MKDATNSIDERRLMGHLAATGAWGAHVGFWATTYAFNPEFFETDFLPSLLGLGAWNDRHWTTRIAMEKELAGMDSASVMVDAQGYPGRSRSLRVEILPARARRHARLHAKVVLVVYEGAVRLLVGSANLTEPGYRHNMEVAVDLTASQERPQYARLISGALMGIGDILAPWISPSAASLTQRASGLLNELHTAESDDAWFTWGGGKIPIWRQFIEHWPAPESIEGITIVSPFWSDEKGAGPVTQLVSELRMRGLLPNAPEVRLLTEGRQVAKTEWRPVLPESYSTAGFSGLGVNVVAESVDPQVSREEVLRDDFLGSRRLHAKIVRLTGQESSLTYIGSANFTHKGWGFLNDPRAANIEAGVILLDSRDCQTELVPSSIGDPVALDGSGTATLSVPDPKTDMPPWPDFIKDVRLVQSPTSGQELDLAVEVVPNAISGSWVVLFSSEGDGLLPELLYRPEDVSRTVTHRVPLQPEHLTRLLKEQEVLIKWWACDDGVLYPLNVCDSARDALPIGPDSRDPNERMLLAYYQGRIAYEELFPPDEVRNGEHSDGLEPLESGVDTSGIQSYQIREFVESLEGIRSDLTQAAASERTMRLALLGPVSPVALARAVCQRVHEGQRTSVAAGFQLVEILACLNALSRLEGKERWEHHWQQARNSIDAMLAALQDTHEDLRQSGPFRTYKKSVMGEPTASR